MNVALPELDRSKVVDIDLGGVEFKQNARRIVAEWAKNPPFYVLGKGPTQVVCGRYADVERVFSDTKTFNSEIPRGVGFEQFHKFMDAQFVTQMDADQHIRIRRLLMPAFSTRRLSLLGERIAEAIEGMLDRIEENGPEFDGMNDYGAQLVVGALLEAIIDLDPRRRKTFLDFHEVLPLTTYTKPGEPFPQVCRNAFEAAASLVEEIIAERRANPCGDFFSDLVNARDNNEKLTDKELFDQIFTLCGGSLSATSRSAGGALYYLYTHTDQLAELVANPELIPAALEECLRIANNGYFTFPRVATCDTELGGTRIFKGMIVRPSPQAANLDPDVFPDPLRFNIHRKPSRIMSFGSGPHYCIGNVLARTTLVTAIKRLLARFPKAHLIDPKFVPHYGGAVGELRIESLPMRIS